MLQTSPYDDLPDAVRMAFSNRAVLSAPEIARLLEMDPKTLRRHLARGDITARQKGFGNICRRWVFTIADVAKYLRRIEDIASRREESLDALRVTLARGLPKGATMNVTLRRRRIKAKTKLIACMLDRPE
jgi:hypothetical protein